MLKVLITGASGMVARATIAHCASLGDEALSLAREDLDISDAGAVAEILERTRPDAIINCAAYTDVDGAETNIDLCYAANAYGVENLATTAQKIGAAFVTISTDYVFDGEKPGFYTEYDVPNPLSVYGKAKLDGEIRARKANPRSIIVRSGWIYGPGGTNFLSKIPALLAGGKSIKAISDSYGTPTFAGDLAKRLRELAWQGRPGLYHLTNSGAGTSYAGFAHKVAEIEGYDQNLVEDISMDSLKRPAARPRNSRLSGPVSEEWGLSPLPDWEEALERFLN